MAPNSVTRVGLNLNQKILIPFWHRKHLHAEHFVLVLTKAPNVFCVALRALDPEAFASHFYFAGSDGNCTGLQTFLSSVDAAYSASLDRVIFISAGPDLLHIYNAASQSDQATVALAGTPLNLSLSPDGMHAAVAFSNAVSYVDLQGAAIEQTFSNVAVDTGKLVVGVGYIYIFPRFQGYARSINLSTAEVTYNGFANADAAVFHPGLNAIYTSYTVISRYSATGVLTYSSSQPASTYYGVFNVCGPLSLSQAGDTIYTGCGTIFRASSDASTDMRYLGVVPGVQNTQSLVQSGTLNQLAVIPKVQSYALGSAVNDDTAVRLFDSVFFNPIGQIATTPFTVNSSSYAAHGRWVFYNSSSSALIIVTQADASAALTQDFAVENVDLRNPNSCNAMFGGTSASITAAGSYATTPILSGQDCLFTAVSNAPWITLASGFYGSGDTALAYIVRPNLSPTPRSGTISVGSQVFTINQDGQTTDSALTPLSFKPVAAEYDKALDRIIMVAASPNELHLYDPVTQSDDIVPLNSIPLSVSVRPDGLFAAVGHSGSMSLIDLQARTITQTLWTERNNGSILLASNGYAYSFPTPPSSGGAVTSIQLSDATSTSVDCLYCNFPRLVPSGNYVYAGNSYGASKLNIADGPAAIVSSNYSNSLIYPLAGRFWLSESGDRIKNSSGNAFLTSTVPALDLSPNGRLSGSNAVAWAANSQLLQQTAVLTDIAPALNTQLQLYADDGLQLQSQIALPGFSNAGRSYVSHGRYVFWNAASSKLFAITQADSTSGLVSDYAIYTISAPASMPTCEYAVSPAGLMVPSSSYSNSFFDVTSNCSWSPVVASTSSNWVYGLNTGFTTENGRAFFSVSTNSGPDRSASVKVGDKNVVITQLAPSCTFSLSSTSRSFSQAGGTGEVNLATDANCPWSVQSDAPWLSVTSNQSGTGPATIRYSVEPNTTSLARRSALLKIAGNAYTVQQTTVPVSSPSNFVPVTPCRIADTRNARGPFGAPFLGANSTRTFSMVFSNCNIPSSASAYSLNITVVPHGRLNYLTAWPSSQLQPFVSTLNSMDGRVKANAAIIDAGLNKAVSFYATDATDLVLDITGYFVNANTGTGLAFYPLTPCRISDSRGANGPLTGPLFAGGETRDLPVLQSGCNLSSSAQAYSLNFTAIPDDDSLQYLTTWPSGRDKPVVSTLNAWTGTVTANAVILQAGPGGDINVYVTNDTHVVIDTNGYFAPPGPGGLYFYSIAPCRVLDTRESGTTQAFKDVLSVQIGGTCNIPSEAAALVLNSTVVPSRTLDYLTLWPSGGNRPVVSTLNAFDGATSSNMAITPLTNGSLDVFATTALI